MTRRPSIAGAALAASLVAPVGHAQTPAGPFLPPMPLPQMPTPVSSGNAGEPTTPTSFPAHPPGASSPTAQRDSLSLSANSPSQREAWRGSQLHEVWYGWQTLTSDAGSVGVLLLGATFGGDLAPFALAAVGVYGVGAPAVHFAHGAVGKGLVSLTVRALLPLGGFGLGYLLGAGSASDRRTEGGVIGAVAGGAGATIFDAAVLGWDRWQGVERIGNVPCFAVSGSF
jgi:hypothetical protein